LVPTGAPVVIGFDDTIERRWGAKISARGIYRDPVRSSKQLPPSLSLLLPFSLRRYRAGAPPLKLE
jgi:hypothetical protein